MPSRPTTKMLRPDLATDCATASGRSPPPAMIPSAPPAVIRSIFLGRLSAGHGHANRPLRRRTYEGDDLGRFGDVAPAFRRLVQAAAERAAFQEQEAIGRPQGMNTRTRNAFALQTDQIQALKIGARALRQAIGNDIGRQPRHAADEAAAADV